MASISKSKSTVKFIAGALIPKNQDYEINEEDGFVNPYADYLFVFFHDDFLGFISKNISDGARNGQIYAQLSGASIIDVSIPRVFLFDDDSLYFNNQDINDSYYDLIDNININDYTVDIFGIPLFLNKVENKTKERSVKQFTGKIEMSFGKVMLAIENHKEFWDLSTDSYIDSESIKEKLIKTAVLQPDQFDELFTVETDRPESPLMRRFMEKLSILVNEQLGDNVEGIDNMDELQSKAYIFTGYQGKNLETVISESKDYFRYFRYLLTKGEKTVINEKQKDYFDSLIKLCRKNQIIKKKSIDYEVSEMTPYSSICFYKEKIPNFHINKSRIEMDYFTFVENIRNTSEELENSNLSIRIALIDELITKEYSDQIKNGIEKASTIFVCDRNLNYCRFLVRGATINKWKKSLEKKLSLADFIISSGRTKIPVGVTNDYIL